MSLLLEALKKAAQEKQAQQKEPGPSDVGHGGDSGQMRTEPAPPELSLEPVTGYQVDDGSDIRAEGEATRERSRGEVEGDGRPEASVYETDQARVIQPPDAGKVELMPQMQGAQPATELSPEAAKRILDSKRVASPRRTRLLLLGGLGIVVLMAVVLSLFYYSSQVANLDQQIATFKREPRALSPPPPRTQPSPGQQDAAAARKSTATASGESEATVNEASIIDQIEEGVVAGSETVNVSDVRSERQKTAARPSGQFSSEITAGGAEVKVERRGAGRSLKVTSGSSAAPSQGGEDIMLRSRSTIPDADRLLLEAYEAYRTGDLELAEQAYGRVLSTRPDDRDALLGLAAIQQLQGSSEGALAIYRRLLELNPKDSVARTGVLELSAAQGTVGESDLKMMLRDQPNAAHLHFALGNVYAGQDRWAEAQGAYFDAYRLAPHNADYAFNLAVSLDQLDKRDVARRYYEQALNTARAGAVVGFSPQAVERRLEVISPDSPEG